MRRDPFAFDPALKDLLAAAARHYRRRENDQFLSLLTQATARAPFRLDLHFNLVSHYIQTDCPAAALDILRQLAQTVPGDTDVQFFLGHWLHFAGERAEAEAVRRNLERVRPERATDLRRLWGDIETWLARPVLCTLPDFDSTRERTAVVVLGYILNADGSMHPHLVERLETALRAAERYPQAHILASGGVPKNGVVEAVAMRRWLIDHGVAPERIHEEGYARDLVENLIYSRQILDILGTDRLLLVTSADNVRRAGAGMSIQGWRHGSGWRVDATACAGASFTTFVDDGRDRLKLYRDALRAYGEPMMRTFPELAEL
ncbi:MAG: YdcF family protein [Planctomycetes bacterium]|nr:YdcF family protein [Planctomycetota bacterium]